ncbi:neural cell adhesion molecule 1-like [Synchiropus splendidus]|uniref:neural cell adhesion molecule 1-like n=1 Tax=Synchiropus splendidus TaxID=270530 RepID=UPI00237DB773|nr:neural cell adhesion molecule 1-like [Synchiropus splendidus]
MLHTRGLIWGLVLIGCAAALQVNIHPTRGSKHVGETTYFRCSVDGGDAKDITWYDPRGRTIEPHDPDLYVTRDGLTSDIVIQRITLDDTGLYKCVAKNDVEEKVAAATLEVFQKITFQDVPSPQTFNEGEDAEIICNVVSTPPPNVFWRYQDAMINYDNQTRFRQLSNHHLQIRGIKKKDEGRYTCEARIPRLGELAFKQVEVRVTDQAKPAETKVDDAVTMTCAASVDPARMCTSCNLGNVEFSDGAQSQARLSSLVFKNFQFANAGQYLCIPSKPGARSSESVHLAFEYAPKISGETTVYTWEGNPANISCEVDAFPAALVVWSRDGVQLPSSNMTNIKIYNTPDVSYLEVTPDSQSGFGNYTCTASNMMGKKSKEFLLTVAGMPSPPKIQLVEPFAEKAAVVFTEPDSSGPPILLYRVRWRLPGKHWVSSVHSFEENMTRVTINDLAPETTYEVKMSAINIRGASEMSPPTTFKTKSVSASPPSVPSSPTIQLVDPFFSDAVVVFTPPESSGGLPIIHYTLEWLLPDGSWVSRLYVAQENMTRITMDDLKPDTSYQVKMSASNAVGTSERSPATTFKMKAITLPSTPEILQVKATTTTAKVVFSDPGYSGGQPIIQYKLLWRTPGSQDWYSREYTTEENLTQLIIDDLTPGATYEVKLALRSAVGWSETSPSFTFHTEPLIWWHRIEFIDDEITP